MSRFSKTPKAPQPDPIGDICKSLVERYWEWTPSMSNDQDPDERTPLLLHRSGIEVSWFVDNYQSITGWVSHGNAVMTKATPREARRLYEAVQKRTAVLTNRPPLNFTESAKLLARAVLDGDETAAHALADEVIGQTNGPRSNT